MLWFDVGVKRYTTGNCVSCLWGLLWFDVGVKRYTTCARYGEALQLLWFDVGVKRYTTKKIILLHTDCCGLM